MTNRRLVFISHANPEDNEFACWLGTRLTAAGYEVWADVLTLLGGQSFWQDIGKIIRNEAAVVVVALSRTSYQKDGILNEVALAVNTAKQLDKQHFVVPIRLDDLPFSDFPEQLIRLNAIEFSENWADGLSALLKTLRETQVPESDYDVRHALLDWRKFRERQSARISDIPEIVFSNWFRITSLPSHLCFTRFETSQQAMERAFKEFQSPTVRHLRLAVSFADADALQLETPDIALSSAYRAPLIPFLQGNDTVGPRVSWRGGQNMVTSLLRIAWEQFVQRRGLLHYEFAHGSAWFVPLDLLENNIATFQDEKGKKRRRRLVGRSEKRDVYWHFAVSLRVSLLDPRRIELRTSVVFTQDGKTPLASKSRAQRLRKSFCKNWWNDRWRDLLRALVAFLANGKEQLSLPLGGGVVAGIAAGPMGFEAPVSILEEDPPLPLDEGLVEDETEADALDFGSDMHDMGDENLLDDGDENEEDV